MGSCQFCKKDSHEQLKYCVCGKVSYCGVECQREDWKSHKSSCPPFVIRESPGKGRGLFATRKIKEGQVIFDEYPLLTVNDGKSSTEMFLQIVNLDDERKAKILQLHDLAETLKNMDTHTVEELISKNPGMRLYKEPKSDEMNKIIRLVFSNLSMICQVPDLYSNTTEKGVYATQSLLNHACVPNATTSWVMGDFKRRQARALRAIEKDEEILINYRHMPEFLYGSREFRRQALPVFLCQCSDCSLDGEALEEKERMREEIREKKEEIERLLGCEGFQKNQPLVPLSFRISASASRKAVKKAMKLAQERVKLIQKLDIRELFVQEMINFYGFAKMARRMDISCENDPEIFKKEALKYAKLFGDELLYYYNRCANN